MADEVKDTGVQEADGEQERFYTADEVEELLNSRIAEAVQQNATELNAKFQKRFNEIKSEKEEASKDKMTLEEQFKQLQDQFKQQTMETQREKYKQSVLSAAAQRGYTLGEDDQDFAFSLINIDAEDPTAKAVALIEKLAKSGDEKYEKGKTEGVQQFVKANGRRVTESPTKSPRPTYQELVAMSDDEYENVPFAVRKEILTEYGEK